MEQQIDDRKQSEASVTCGSKSAVERLVMRHYRPGRGWRKIAGPVWELPDGTRAHIGGMCRLPNGTHISGSKWPEGREMHSLIKINGGNRKRGVLAWAAKLASAGA